MTASNVSINDLNPTNSPTDNLEQQDLNHNGSATEKEETQTDKVISTIDVSVAPMGENDVSEVATRPLTWLPRESTELAKSEGKRAFAIANRMNEAATLENLYQVTVVELRKRLKCDRACLYRFGRQVEGGVVAESVVAGFTPMLDESFNILAFGASSLEDYRTRAAIALEDTSKEAASPHQMQLFQRFQVQASLSLPVYENGQLWGLLVAQQCSETRAWDDGEIGLMYQVSTELTLKLQAHALQQQAQAEIARGEALANITQSIRQSRGLQQIFELTTRSLRNFLKSDRVAVFQFTPGSNNGSGEIIAESVDPNFVSAKQIRVEDHCFGGKMAEAYRTGRYWASPDIYDEGLAECHLSILAQFQVRANLVVPLRKNNQLWGLFCIHQCRGPRAWQPVEVSFVQRVASQLDLAMQQAEYLQQVEDKTAQAEAAFTREKLISKITDRLRDTSDLSNTLRATVQDIRQMLEADRVGMYQFDPDQNYLVGEFVVEDVAVGVRSAMATKFQDHCFAEEQAENYRQGRYWVVNDVDLLNVDYCLKELLKQLQVRASIVVPLLKGDVLWGLFAIHQCQGPRKWKEEDVQFAHRIGAQLNLALQQQEYYNQVQEKTAQLTETAEREKTSKEQFQQEVIALLQAVGPALEGDLTVRARVSETEVGTVASAYNNTLQSLQKIVRQVQAAANQVSETSSTSEHSAGTVSQRAAQQAEALEAALTRVQGMVTSTEGVAKDAQQVAAATQQAKQIVKQGDVAMNRTVDGIMTIRSTVAETNQRIKRLSESSQKVSKIVSLISQFTTQTQLLALNASIEATRAGQYGRGFAVVADEVRSLARQSAAAATEIEQFVQEIQMGTAEVSSAMEVGIQQVAQGTDMVTDAQKNLTAIVEATEQISKLMAEITQAANQQVGDFKVVTESMDEAAGIAKQTVESSSVLTQSIQQVLSTAEELQTSTRQFKTE